MSAQLLDIFWPTLNDIANRQSFEQKGQDSLVRLLCRRGYLYRSCRYAVRGIDFACSGMDLLH